MGEEHKPIYGSLQYPQTDYPLTDNPPMDIQKTISANLNAWMEGHPRFGTIKAVAIASGVGFGTVQRVKNGDGNPTIKNLVDIAKIFKRNVEDLLVPIDKEYPKTISSEATNIAVLAREPSSLPYLVQDIVNVCFTMSEIGQAELLGHAKQIAQARPAAKANLSS